MPTDVIMPALGMAQETGTVLHWKKRAGDQVVKGEPLLEVETDKAVVEVESPASGTLATISAEAGTEVPIGTVIAVILAAGESPPHLLGRPPAKPAGGGVQQLISAVHKSPDSSEARLQPASPKARRLAAESSVNLAAVAGSGPGGAVVTADLPEAAEESALDVGRTWRIMAERTATAWAAPHFYLTREVMAAGLLAVKDEKATITDLLVKLSATTLERHPHLCSSWREGRLVRSWRVSIGVAVASEDGLMVPVLHDADRKSLAEISAWREGVVERARAHRLHPQDLEGGVFTISNLGMYGVDAFTAIINAGQASILSVGRIAERPVARNGKVEVAQTMILTLGCDHRAVDGTRGALFLNDLVSAVEEVR